MKGLNILFAAFALCLAAGAYAAEIDYDCPNGNHIRIVNGVVLAGGRACKYVISDEVNGEGEKYIAYDCVPNDYSQLYLSVNHDCRQSGK